MDKRSPEGIREGSHRRAQPPQRRRVWLIAGFAVGTVALLAAATMVGHHAGRSIAEPTSAPAPVAAPSASVTVPGSVFTSPPLPALGTLESDFDQFESSLNAVAGISIGAVGSTDAPITLGHWKTGPAWSTIKVPLAIAALRKGGPPTVTDTMRAAITESDNAAAESIWAILGDPVSAAQQIEGVLGPTGDPTTVQSQTVRPPFTAFGQTDWSLPHQVQFISSAACDVAAAPILTLMGQIESGQSWGVGTIADTRFKGGWGPSPTGDYLVRQFGVIATPNGMIAVALAVEPASGQFDDGTADLTKMAQWLKDHMGELPTGQCPP